MQSRTCPACHSTYPPDSTICPHDGSLLQPDGSSSPEHSWPPGKVIGGKYVVFARTGEDEVTWVYRARNLELDELRSLRALRADLARDAGASGEFRRTARLLQKLVHPNLMSVEACGDAEDGCPFLATDATPSASLADLLCAEGPLEPLRVCSIARQIAAALAAAHQVGLLHLGLSPSNVLVSAQPEGELVKVQGFGTASIRASRERARRSHVRPTLHDLMPPHPPYCSPEQALGKPVRLLDARTDLYSLGVMMHQMMTGRLPFWQPAGEDLTANGEADLAPLVSHLEDAPLPVSVGGRPDTPEPLAHLVVQLLEKRPELRVPTADVVIETIRLAEDRIAARAILGAPQSAMIGAASAIRAAEAVTAAGPAEADSRPLPALPLVQAPQEVAPRALISEPRGGAPSGTQPAPNAAFKVTAGREAAGSAAASTAERAVTSARRPSADSASILFKAQPQPNPNHWARWVLASLSVIVVAGGVWFFSTRAQHQWLGSGPLSPIKSDELRAVEGANAEPSSAPASPSPSASQPAASAPAGSAHAAAQKPEERGPQGSAASQAPPATMTSAGNSASTATPGGVPPATKRLPVAAREGGAKPAASPGDIAAEVKRAVSAGDVFFELGQYDLAMQAYERPLKLDPNNSLLRARIQRAQSAKNAEQEFLQQQ